MTNFLLMASIAAAIARLSGLFQLSRSSAELRELNSARWHPMKLCLA